MFEKWDGSICISISLHVNAQKQNSWTPLFFHAKGISECSSMNARTRSWMNLHMHTSSLSNPSTNSPLVEGVHCFSFILISLSPFKKKKIHIRFSLSWPQSEPLKQSITLLVFFVSPDLSLSMESTPLSWSRVGESRLSLWAIVSCHRPS